MYGVGLCVSLGWMAYNYAMSSYLQMPIKQARESWLALGILIGLCVVPAAVIVFLWFKPDRKFKEFLKDSSVLLLAFSALIFVVLYMISRPEIAPFSMLLITNPIGQLSTPETGVFLQGAARICPTVILANLVLAVLAIAVIRASRAGKPMKASGFGLPLLAVLVLFSFQFGRLSIPLIKPEFGGMLLKEATLRLKDPAAVVDVVVIASDSDYLVSMREQSTAAAVASLLNSSRSDELGRRLVYVPTSRITSVQPRASVEIW